MSSINVLLKSFVVTAVFMATCLSFANDTVLAPASPTPTPAPTLKGDMKAIGTLIKTLAQDINNPAMNQESIKKAEELIALFKQSQTHVPTSILKMAADQQGPAMAEYKALLQKEIDACIALQQALLANDNVTAVNVFKEMSVIKREGHKKFDPPPATPTPH